SSTVHFHFLCDRQDVNRALRSFPTRRSSDLRAAVISSNGFRVDRKKAQARVDELAARREVILGDLQERYGLPTEGDAPWSTQAGKEAILDALADYGITPETVEWPKTPAW